MAFPTIKKSHWLGCFPHGQKFGLGELYISWKTMSHRSFQLAKIVSESNSREFLWESCCQFSHFQEPQQRHSQSVTSVIINPVAVEDFRSRVEGRVVVEGGRERERGAMNSSGSGSGGEGGGKFIVPGLFFFLCCLVVIIIVLLLLLLSCCFFTGFLLSLSLFCCSCFFLVVVVLLSLFLFCCCHRFVVPLLAR